MADSHRAVCFSARRGGRGEQHAPSAGGVRAPEAAAPHNEIATKTPLVLVLKNVVPSFPNITRKWKLSQRSRTWAAPRWWRVEIYPSVRRGRASRGCSSGKMASSGSSPPGSPGDASVYTPAQIEAALSDEELDQALISEARRLLNPAEIAAILKTFLELDVSGGGALKPDQVGLAHQRATARRRRVNRCSPIPFFLHGHGTTSSALTQPILGGTDILRYSSRCAARTPVRPEMK